MGAVWTNTGIFLAAKAIAGGPALGLSWRFRPYVNVVTPTFASMLADFTPPSNSGGGAIAGASWSPVAAVSGVSTSPIASLTWIFSANIFVETVFGYTFEIFDGTIWQFCAANNITTPYLIPPAGGFLNLAFTLSVQKLP